MAGETACANTLRERPARDRCHDTGCRAHGSAGPGERGPGLAGFEVGRQGDRLERDRWQDDTRTPSFRTARPGRGNRNGRSHARAKADVAGACSHGCTAWEVIEWNVL